MMALDGVVHAGSSDFGYEESTVFNVAPNPENYVDEQEIGTAEGAEELSVRTSWPIIPRQRTSMVPLLRLKL